MSLRLESDLSSLFCILLRNILVEGRRRGREKSRKVGVGMKDRERKLGKQKDWRKGE